MASASAQLLRRIAGRVGDVTTRHDDEPAVHAYAASLLPKTQEFILAYDAVAKYTPRHDREFTEGRAANKFLYGRIQAWAPLAIGAIPGVSRAELSARPEMPDDLHRAVHHLLDLLHDEAAAGNAIAFAADLEADLGPALASAEKEWHEAVAADVTLQSLLKAQREKLAAFDGELQRFRRTLVGAIGRSHKDYQKLRSEKAHLPDESDDPTGPAPAATPEPAAP